MSSAVALWSLPLVPGKKIKFTAVGDIRLTNAALDADLASLEGRTVVKLNYEKPMTIDDEDEDEEKGAKASNTSTTILCALTAGKIEHANLDIVLTADDEFVFETIGENTIYLTGNYIDQHDDEPPADYDSDTDSDGVDGYDLRDVSSDVEVDPMELELVGDSDEEDDSHRFEEIDDSASKSKKRAADGMDTDGVKDSDSKKEKKNKKQKAEDGKAIPSVDGALVNGAAKEAKKDKKEKKDKKDKKEGAEKKSIDEGLKELSSGLKLKDVKTGTGKMAKKGDTVSMRYIGKFLDGKIFDKNTSGKPFSFKLGDGEVIKGWDEGIAGMQAGGERLLIVPSKLGYGNRKIDSIPAGSTLRFECKLLEIK